MPRLRLLFCALLALACTAALAQQPLFPIADALHPGRGTGITADFNNDGKTDLAILTLTTTYPSVTLYLDVAGIAPPAIVTTSSIRCTSTSLIATDMDRDRKLDLVLTCTEGYIVVLLGNGDGTFATPTYYAVPGPSHIIAVDLNADGYPDIVASTQLVSSAPSLVALLNQGSLNAGALVTPRTYPTLSTSNITNSISTGDFNGDGKQDIVAQDSSSLNIFYGNGDGTLQPEKSIAPGGLFLAADLNHDGIDDLVTVVSTSVDSVNNIYIQSLQVLLGSSSGVFTPATNLPLDTSQHYSQILPFTTSGGSTAINLLLVGNDLTVFSGDGAGAFTQGPSYASFQGPIASLPNSTGGTDLLAFGSDQRYYRIPGNSDATFQALPTHSVGNHGFLSADTNNDGLTDILYLDAANNLISALGRGNGAFVTVSTLPSAPGAPTALGDFNNDGNLDLVAIGYPTKDPLQHAILYLYTGDGFGGFHLSPSTVDLQVYGAGSAVVADFNNDGKLDVVLQYRGSNSIPGGGLVFLPGNGDGTFGNPHLFSQQNTVLNTTLLLADVNNDRKPDLLWNNALYLGNGDGTFRQSPQPTPLAIGDLNGDGNADLITYTGVYAGNGDGTFQPASFFNFVPPININNASASGALVADFNGDGNADLLLDFGWLAVYYGDGRGNFTSDSNNPYFAGAVPSVYAPQALPVLARLNNAAHNGPPDVLTFTNNGATSLLNQRNPAPAAAAPVRTLSTLASSTSTANEDQQLTLTASVTGLHPTGTITFRTDTSTLGTAPLVNGTATLITAFTSAGPVSVTSSYPGDANNLPSTSSAATITILAPDFSIAPPSSLFTTIQAGQSAAFTFHLAATGGYTGTVNFSCGTLPALISCSFSPASVTLSGSGASSTLTISTTSAISSLTPRRAPSMPQIAALALFLFLFLPTNARLKHRLPLLLLFAATLTFAGCGSTGSSTPAPTHTPIPGTAPGTYAITVSASGSAGNLLHSSTVQITVQ